MAINGQKKIASKSSSRKNELVAILLLLVAILVFLSLISYSAGDLSSNSTGGNSAATKNWIGLFGAFVSDWSLQIIGLTAYIIPAMLALIAWRVFRAVNMYIPIGRLIGFILFIGTFAGLLSILLDSGFRGGIVGAFIAGGCLALIGKVGSIILLSALFFASILLTTNLTYLSIFSGVGLAFDNLRLRFDDYFSSFKHWRERQKLEAQERLEKRLEARNELENEIAEKEKTTVSLGDKPDKKPAIIDEKPINAKNVNSGEIGITEELKEITKPEETKKFEDLRPKISMGADPVSLGETEDLPKLFDDDISAIPITPIKETGELEQIKLSETNDLDLPQTDETEVVLPKTDPPNYDNYILPPTDFLTAASARIEQKDEELLEIAKELTEKSGEFNVTGRVMHICQGPVVTTYEFKPDAGVKYSRVTGLADDLCLALKAESIRIDRIPGKAVVGIEVPNRQRETIQLREVIESTKFKESNSLLSIALGKSIDGRNYVADLTKMPHLLIAGATGAGKSVGVNTLIVSILYKAKPDEVKLIMVDPKQVELGIYADIPHLATPIITDPKRASISLKWAVGQMEKRYKDLARWGVRNIDGYNAEVKRKRAEGILDDEGNEFKNLPYLVIIIDELADLMMVAGKEVEESITRLAQMARAVGIHLVLATQRPSVDVITGLIKANFPSRISFRVSSKVDSRTIIDANGAESLLGKGDMLFLPPGTSNLIRVHGAFVDEKEINKIVEHIKAQGRPDYDITITKTEDELDNVGDLPGKKDPLFMDALRSVVSAKRASTSLLQRHLRIGYGRAAAILDAMVREEFIGEMDGSSRARPILEKAYEYLEGYDSADNV